MLSFSGKNATNYLYPPSTLQCSFSLRKSSASFSKHGIISVLCFLGLSNDCRLSASPQGEDTLKGRRVGLDILIGKHNLHIKRKICAPMYPQNVDNPRWKDIGKMLLVLLMHSRHKNGHKKVHALIHKMWTTYVDMGIDNFALLKGLKRRRFFNLCPTCF